MAAEQVKLTRQGNLAVITLNRPEARNALSSEMMAELGAAIRSCKGADVRAVVLTGSGGAFCSGADVKDFAAQLEESGPEGLAQHLREVAGEFHREVILGIRRLNKPVVAAIDGVAAGGGFSLMLACDLRIASSNARFLMAYAGIGATADGGSTYMLPRLVGQSRAMELYLAGQPLSAQAALDMGLINQMCPAEELDRHALETATRLSEGPTLAYGRVKALFERSWSAGLEEQLDAETDGISNSGLTEDFHEGVRAFTDKRRPRFQGK